MITVGEGFLTYEELAARLLVKRQTIYNRVNLHRLPHTIIAIGQPPRRRIAIVPPETAAELARLLGRTTMIRRKHLTTHGDELLSRATYREDLPQSAKADSRHA